MAYGTLRIGWSSGDITPPKKTLLQGQFHARIAEDTLSPLTATVLAVDVLSADGNTEQAIFISCDLCYEPGRDALVQELSGRCPGIDPEKITLSATHTHTAPVLRRGQYDEPEDDPDFMNPDEYKQYLISILANLVEAAWNTRSPGGISRGFGYAVIGRCRRATYGDGSALMYGESDREDFAGFESWDDHAVNMLFARDPNGELTGIIVNLACTAQCDESLSVYSADYWFDVRRAVAERYGTDVHVLPLCAPAGDMSPHLLADRTEECDLRNRAGLDARGMICRRIMAAIDEGMSTSSETKYSIHLDHLCEQVELPRLMVSDEEYELEKRMRTMDDEERTSLPFQFQRVWPFGHICDLISRYETQASHPEKVVEIHVMRIGDAAFATNPFELYVDYGIRIRCRSKALQTFLVQLADGSAEGGYLPTRRAIAGGHYSAVTKSNWVGPEGGDILVQRTVDEISKLFRNTEYPRTR